MSGKDDAISFLRSVLHVDPIHEEQLAELASVCSFHSFAAGEHIFFEDEQSDLGYYVVTGRVVLKKTSRSGKQLIVALLPAGEPFGLLAALDGRPFPLTAQAQSACTVLVVPGPAFSRLLECDAGAQRALTATIGERLRASHELARALAHDRVELRVAAALLSLRPRCGGTDPDVLLLSRQELADAVGISLETATRTMKSFEQEGIVDLSKFGKVRILKTDRLAEIIDEAE